MTDSHSHEGPSGGYRAIELHSMEEISIEAPKQPNSSSRRSSRASLFSETSYKAGNPPEPLSSRALRRLKSLSAFVTGKNVALNNRIRASRYHGWRIGVLVGCGMSAFVLCCNIIILIVGSQVNGGYKQGLANLVFGSAPTISKWSTTAHLVINVFSTMLLGASNYAMQVLSSPTRVDIDGSHATGRWLDVGVLSTRNLRAIPRRRTMLWALLALSSVPLHLFYNAAVFQLNTHNEYNISFLHADSQEFAELDAVTKDPTSTLYSNFSSRAWKQTYGAKYLSEFGDLYLGIHAFTFDNLKNATIITDSIVVGGGQDMVANLTDAPWSRDGDWLNCTHVLLFRNHSGQQIYPSTAHVQKAIATNVVSKSSLQLSRDFMTVVIVFNLLKLLILWWILVHDRSEYIVTLGDAVASFLQHPDKNTRLKCVLNKEDILFGIGHCPHLSPYEGELNRFIYTSEGVWRPSRVDRFTVLTRDKQILLALLFCAALSANALVPLYNATSDWRWSTSSGLIVNGGAPALTNAWIVNTPQLALSVCYLGLNSICTSLAGAEEWNNMARVRKTLRVTDPQGEQRSTYFLQLPYRWGVPLMITSSALHWLLSQTFFLVRLNVMDRQGRIKSSESISACGFSILSLTVFCAVATVLICAIVSICMRRMKQKMPIAGSCSMVISAACHVPQTEVDPHLQKLQWGVVQEQFESGFDHCCFTSTLKPKRPVQGRKYR